MTRERLRDELERLRAEGTLDDGQSKVVFERLAATLFPQRDRMGALTAIIATLGAVLVAAGILFVVAGNWDDIPKWWKLGLLVGTWLGIHHFGFALAEGSARSPRVGRALTGLGVLVFGAVIGLVAQMYGLDAHYPWALLIWALTSVPFALLTRNRFIGAIVVVLAGIWAFVHAAVFLGDLPDESWDAPAMGLPLLCLGMGVVLKLMHANLLGTRFASLEFVPRFFASPLVITWIYLHSFREFADDLPRIATLGFAPIAPFAVAAAVALVLLIPAWIRGKARHECVDAALLLLAGAFFAFVALKLPGAFFVLANVALLVILLVLIVRGVQLGLPSYVNWGVLGFVVAVITKYFEFFHEHLHGAAFVGPGIVLIAVALGFERLRKKLLARARSSGGAS